MSDYDDNMRGLYRDLALQISRIFITAERSDISGWQEDRAARIDRVARRLTEFTSEYIEAMRVGVRQFTQTEAAGHPCFDPPRRKPTGDDQSGHD